MKNWQQLTEIEQKEVWDNFYRIFDFSPSIDNFPGIRTSLPYKKYSITKYFSSDVSTAKLEDLALTLFTKISNPGDRLYALDWQHSCYDFDPRLEMERDEFGEWVIPILPNGDYHIFLTKDFKNVWFGHPWEQTITLIGQDIVQQVEYQNATI